MAVIPPTDSLAGEGISVRFGGVQALAGVGLRLESGQILGLIGPNGSGKTTLLNVLSGFLRPLEGVVSMNGVDVTGKSPARLARRGIVRTFQGVRLFQDLTVRENVLAGGLGRGLNRHAAQTHATTILRQMNLIDRQGDIAGALPYGYQRRVALARAVAAKPSFLLLDEPTAGLNESETDQLCDVVESIRDSLQCGVLLIEHDMRVIMRVSERIHVLDAGKTIATGNPQEIRVNTAVRDAYLGAGS